MASLPARADILFLNGGEELSGTVTKVDGQNVYLEAQGQERVFPRQKVLKLKLVRHYSLPGEDEVSKIRDKSVLAALALSSAAAQYPDDGFLNVMDEQTCELRKDGAWSCAMHRVQRILRERGKDPAANVRLYYLDGFEKGAIEYARSVTDGRVSYLDDTETQEGSEYPNYPEYDRLKSLKFATPNVDTGSVVDYAFHTEATVAVSTRPFFAQMNFRFFEPSETVRLAFLAPKGTPILFSTHALPQDASFVHDERGGLSRYVWETHAQPSFKEEDNMPPFGRLAPHVGIGPKDDWEHVARLFYASISTKALEGEPTEEIKRKAESPERKVEALYNWVVRNIKYQPVEMGYYSYVPKDPNDILRSKTGNGLDKAFLLMRLLQEAGFKAGLAYLESKEDAPFDPGLPNIQQFSGAAATLDLDGRTLFLSPLESTRRYLETPGWFQGVHGLVIVSTGSPAGELGRIIETPLSEAARESEEEETRLGLDPEGGLRGETTIRPLGGHQAGWRGLKDLKKEDLDRRFEEIAHGIHPNARLMSYSIDNLDDLSRDLVVHFAFSVRDYAITASGGYMAFRIPGAEHPAWDVGQPKRETPLFWYERDRSARKVRIELPKGYALYFAPEERSLDGPGCSYAAGYKHDPAARSLDFSEEMTRNATEIAPEDYPAYKTYRERVARFGEQWIVLKRR